MKKDGLEIINEIMPEGWKEAAKTEGALIRSRSIKTPEELLRLNFLYQTTGESYGLTAALTQISENQESLNKTAVQKRIVNSGNWLKWICEHLSRQEGYIVSPPEWLGSRRVCLVDASDYSIPGSKGADFRLHYMMDLFTLNTTEMYFTNAQEGEKLTRYTHIQENDLIIADRAYGTVSGINHVLQYNADFVLRLRATCFNLYDANGEKFNLTDYLKGNKPGKKLNFHLYCRTEKGKYIPIRICATCKTEEQFERSQKQTKISNHKRKAPSNLQSIWNRYIVVATSLPDKITTEQVLELYRMRWQVELVFKRFKSIFGGRKFTVRKDTAVKAWFYGKLLLAIVCETLAKQGRFFPYA